MSRATPESTFYAGFADFKLYRVVVERGQLVAGFGRNRLDRRFGPAVLPGQRGDRRRRAGDHCRVNEQLGDILAGCIARRLGHSGAGWRATGCDPEGLDIRSGAATARLEFDAPVSTADAVAAALA